MSAFRTLLAASLIVLAQPALADVARAHNELGSGAGLALAAPAAHLASEGDCQSIAEARRRVGSATGTAAAKVFEREGAACVKAGDLTAAIAHFSEALRRSAWRSATYVRRGEARARLGEHEFAVLDYDQAIRLNPDHPRFHHLRAVSLAAIGRAEAAVDDLEQALRLDDPKVVSRLQQHLTKKGYETAVDGEYDPGTRRALVACVSTNCIRL